MSSKQAPRAGVFLLSRGVWWRTVFAIALSFVLTATLVVMPVGSGDTPAEATGTLESQTAGDVALVVGGLTRDGSYYRADQVIADLLVEAGLEPRPVIEFEASSDDVDGVRLVVISATVRSQRVRVSLDETAAPVVNFEAFLAEELEFAQSRRDTFQTRSRTSLDIVDSDHPLAAGLEGRVQVTNRHRPMSAARPAGEVRVVAQAGSTPVLFAYEAGAALADGTPAPARRVFAFPSAQSARSLTEDGRALLAAAFEWALTDPGPVGNAAPTVDAGSDVELRSPAATATLAGSVDDDGLPSGSLELAWTQVSGPSEAVVASPAEAVTDISGLVVGSYLFELTAVDGELTGSDQVAVHVLPVATLVALITGPVGRQDPDQLFRDRLAEAGAVVVEIADSDARSADYTNIDLIFVSSTVRSNRIGDHFTTSDLPVVTNEAWLLRDLDMGRWVRSRWTRTLDIVDPANPLAAGFDGPIAISSRGSSLGTAVPASGASIVAEARGRAALFEFQAGDLLLGDTPAPGYRLYFPGRAQTSRLATSAYVGLLDAAIARALDAVDGGGGEEPTEPLVARPDTGATNEDLSLSTSVEGGVLANDTGEGTLVVTGFDAVSTLGATVSVEPDGSFVYDPTEAAAIQDLAAGATIEDDFTYTVTDDTGATAVGTVTVTVAGLDEPFEEPSIRTPVFAEGWQAQPEEIIFTDDGQSATVELVHYGPDGTPSGDPVPAGVTVQRDTSLFGVSQPTDGSIAVTGSETVGSELLIVTIPGGTPDEDQEIRVWVTSVRLQPDVRYVPQNEVVFPQPQTAEVTSFDPFTSQELVERTNVDPDTTTKWIPTVIQGPAPAPGTKLAGSLVFGRVIEPPGLPSITRDGLTLISLELIPFTEVYTDLKANIDFSKLKPAAPQPETTTGNASGSTTGNATDDTTGSTTGSGGTGGTGGTGSAAGSSRPLISGPLLRLPATTTPPTLGPCEVSIGPKFGNVTVLPDYNFELLGQFNVDAAAGSFEFIDVGPRLSITAGPRGALSVGGQVSLACNVLKLAAVDLTIPGPLQAVATIALLPVIKAEFAIESTDPFKADIDFSCTVSVAVTFSLTGSVTNGFGGELPTVTPTSSCNNKFDTGPYYASGIGPGLTLEPKFGVKLEVGLGVRPGGFVTATMGKVVNNPGLGVLTIAVFSAGPEVSGKLENLPKVVAAQANQTQLGLGVAIKGGLNDQPLKDVLALMFAPGVVVDNPTELSTTFPVGNLVDPPTGGGIGVTRDGVPSVGSFTRVIGDSLLEATVTAPAFLGFGIDEVFVYEDDNGSFTDAGSLFAQAINGSTATLSLQFDENLCSDFEDGKAFRVATYLGTAPFRIPAYVGRFSVKCQSTVELGFQPRNSTIRSALEQQAELTPVDSTANIVIEQIGEDGKPWTLEFLSGNDDGLLSFPTPSGTFAAEETLVRVALDCGSDDQAEGSAFIGIRVAGALSTSQIRADYSCGEYFYIRQSFINQGGSFYVVSSGSTDDTWTATRGAKVLAQTSGDLPADTTVNNPVFTRPKRPNSCDIDTGAEFVRLSTNDRGDDTVYVVPPQPKPPTSGEGDGLEEEGTCNDDDGGSGGPSDNDEKEDEDRGDGPAGPRGDPHIRSFDGLTYGAQVLGEYLYSQTSDGQTRLFARHESTKNTPGAEFRATSATGLAVVRPTTKVEYLAGPTPLLLVNGNPVQLPVGQSVNAGDGISIVQEGERKVAIRAPGLRISASMFVGGSDQAGGSRVDRLDFQVWATDGETLTGFLGSNDGNPANDLASADGEIITFDEARAHGEAFYRFTESWRLNDPAASPFTLPSAQFASPNEPRPSEEALAPFRQQALDVLSAITSMCAGDFNEDAYIIDVFAIELAVGIEPGDLDELSCTYDLNGRVMTDLNGADEGGIIGVHNAAVVIDAVGLQPCEAVTLPNGSFRCLALPDLDEIGDGSGISFPLPITIDTAVPGQGQGAAGSVTTSASIPSRPLLAGTASFEIGTVELDTADLKVVELSGTITDNGNGRNSETAFELQYRDGSGADLGSRTRAVDPVDGAYDVRFVVPADTASVEVVWDRAEGDEDDPSTLLTGLTNGINSFAFDPVFNPALVEVTGTARLNGVAPESVALTVDVVTADGGSEQRSISVPVDPNTGAYRAVRALPLDAVSAQATIEVFDNLDTAGADSAEDIVLAARSAAFPTLVSGLNSSTVDIEVETPTIEVTGSVNVDGSPVSGNTLIQVSAVRSGGAPYQSAVVVEADLAGAFQFDLTLPEDATSVTLVAERGPSVDDFPTLTTPVSAGSNPITFEATVESVVLDVSGTVLGGGLPYQGPVTVAVNGPTFDGRLLEVNAGPDGRFQTSVALPIATTSATVSARPDDVAVIVASAQETVTNLSPGTTPVSVDVVFNAVAVAFTGTLTDATRGSVPVIDPTDLVVEAFDAADERQADDRRRVEPDAFGAYVTRSFLPPDTTAIDVAVLVGDAPEEGRTRNQFTGLTPGVNNVELVFDHNPPIVDLSGAFTADGVAVGGLQTFVFDSTYPTRDGGTATLRQEEQILLSLIDGSYAAPIELPQSATSVEITAQVGADPSSFRTATIDPLVPGSNPLAIGGDLLADTRVVITATLLAGGQPFVDETPLDYVARDDAGAEVASGRLQVDPGITGQASALLDLPNQASAIELTWPLAPEEVLQADLTRGALNEVAFSVDDPQLVATISGTLTEGGEPFTDSTSFELIIVDLLGDSESSQPAVTPNPDGTYSLDVDLPPGAATLRIRWPEAVVTNFEDFDLTSSLTVPFSGASNVGQRVVLRGTATVGPDAWPLPIDGILRPRRTAGSSFGVPFTLTPDPVTGAYEFVYNATTAISEVALIIDDFGISFETFPVEAVGLTEIERNLSDDGLFLGLSGRATEGGQPTSSFLVFVADADDPDRTVLSSGFVDADANGDFDLPVRISVPDPAPTNLVLGFGTGEFEGEVEFGTVEVPFGSGVIDVPDLTVELPARPEVQLSGNLAVDGVPVSSTRVTVTWFDDDQSPAQTWESSERVFPDANGDYTLQVRGPVAADRVDIRFEIDDAEPAESLVSVAVTPGDNPVELNVTKSPTTFLEVSGALRQNIGQDFTDTLLFTARAADGSVIGTVEGRPRSGSDNTYTLLLPIPETATEGTLTLQVSNGFGGDFGGGDGGDFGGDFGEDFGEDGAFQEFTIEVTAITSHGTTPVTLDGQ